MFVLRKYFLAENEVVSDEYSEKVYRTRIRAWGKVKFKKKYDLRRLTTTATDSGYASLDKAKMARQGVDVYSQVSSVHAVAREMLIQRFAEHLFKDLGGKALKHEMMTTMIRGLPDLLANFAFRLGQVALSEELRNATAFIYKHRT